MVIYVYFIYISQDSAEMHSLRVGIYNNLKLSRVCQWKNVGNRSIIGEDMGKSKVPHFYW